MNVWVIKACEPLPVDGTAIGPGRVGMLTSALLERGHNVTLWVSTFGQHTNSRRADTDRIFAVDDRCKIQIFDSVKCQDDGSFRHLRDHARVANRLSRAIRSLPPPELIVCCFPTVELASAAVEYGARENVPVVIDVHEPWPDNVLMGMPRASRRLAEMLLRSPLSKAGAAFSRSAGVVGVSQGCLDHGLRYAGRKLSANDTVFPLGCHRVSISQDRLEDARTELITRSVDPSKINCWCAGTLEKGVELGAVIDAARRLASRGIVDVRFVFTGEGEMEAALRARSRGLENVVFTGPLDPPRLAAMASLAHIGLLVGVPGLLQSPPAGLYEYMRAGVPILSGFEGETEELLHELQCGMSYLAEDHVTLSELLETLRTDPEMRTRMGRNGRLAFEARYSAEIIYPAMAAYLEGLALPTRVFAPSADQPPRGTDFHRAA